MPTPPFDDDDHYWRSRAFFCAGEEDGEPVVTLRFLTEKPVVTRKIATTTLTEVMNTEETPSPRSIIDKPKIPEEQLERLRQAVSRPSPRPEGAPPPEPRLCGMAAHAARVRDGTATEQRVIYSTTLGEVMARNGRKFPTIPDVTLADLEAHRRDGVPVNIIAAQRLHLEYLRSSGDHTSEIADALVRLWRKDRPHTEAEWAAIYKGFYRVEQAKRAGEREADPWTC